MEVIRNTVEREGHIIHVYGKLTHQNLPFALSSIHNAIEKAKFEEIVLDFSKCTAAFSADMLAICAQAMAYREVNVNTKLELPTDDRLSRLFINANWAHLIDPRRYEPSIKNFITSHIPATQYKNPAEHKKVVDKFMNVLLGLIPELNRSDFEAFEWAINEITDNVLTHAQSSIGGLIQLTLHKNKQKVQYAVADTGIGIPESMRSGEYPSIKDVDALDKAIREGVTRDKSLGQGNGLYGSYQISSICHGNFQIRSGHGNLLSTDKDGLHIKNEKIPFNGTLVAAEVTFSDSGLLANALKFGGKQYLPVSSSIDAVYEHDPEGNFLFILKDEAESFGTRPAGVPVRNKLSNLCKMTSTKKIRIDFSGVPLMSSSFADESFGKLFIEIGPIDFTQKIEFINIADTAKSLINKAIMQRMKSI